MALDKNICATHTEWFWRVTVVTGVPLFLFALYLFSLGPILRFFGAKPLTASSRVPTVVRVIYEPLDRMPIPEGLGRLLRRYNLWWMGVEKDKREFRDLMARLDGSITNGMSQLDVTRLLGEAKRWTTNADTVVAHYFYMPDAVLYGGCFTNGFNVGFSNGTVVCKSYVTSGK